MTHPDPRADIAWRLAQIKGHESPARFAVRENWPHGVPLWNQGGHTAAQLEQIARLLDTVEDRYELGWATQAEPRPQPADDHDLPAPAYQPPDESEPLDPGVAAHIRLRLNKLTPTAHALVNTWTRQSHLAGASINYDAKPTLRRGHLARAAITLAQFEDPDIINAAIRTTWLPDECTADNLGRHLARIDTGHAAELDAHLWHTTHCCALHFHADTGQPHWVEDRCRCQLISETVNNQENN